MADGTEPIATAVSHAPAGATARPHPLGRAEKRERSRHRVEKVALAMFAQRGFDAVTVEDICAEAQISPATFYRYFGSKEGVIFRYEGDFLAAAAELGGSVDPALQPPDQVSDILRRCAEFFEGQRDIRVVRDEIVLANTALLRHTYFVERRFEAALAEALATARQEDVPSTGTLLDAALCMVILRLALVAWRHDDDARLELLTRHVHESLRARVP
jgi:AcrR family transcriptional regulator